MAERYSITPYQIVFGDPFELSFNLIFARTYWKDAYEKHQERERKRNSG